MTNIEKYAEVVAEMLKLQSQIEALRKEGESLWASMTDADREQYKAPVVRKSKGCRIAPNRPGIVE